MDVLLCPAAQGALPGAGVHVLSVLLESFHLGFSSNLEVEQWEGRLL